MNHRELRSHQPGCPEALEESPNQSNCTCQTWESDHKVTYATEPIPAMKTVDKPAPAMVPPMIPGAVKSLAAIIEVSAEESLKNHTGDPGLMVGITDGNGTKVAFQKIFMVNGHNYLFTSKCCMECIEVKHKNMLRAYLIDHGMKAGSIKLWWKVWRANR